MSSEWKERLTNLGLSILFGKPVKQAVIEQAVDVGQDKINDAVGDKSPVTILAEHDRKSLEGAIYAISTARNQLLTGARAAADENMNAAIGQIRSVLG